MNILLRLILLIFLAFAGHSYATTTAVAYGYGVNAFQAGVENLNNDGPINPSGCRSNLSSRDSQDRARVRSFFAFAADLDVPKRTGTVWDDIKHTQDVYPGSVIPKSFELSTPSGQKIWVHGNATEHLAEYAQGQARHYAPDVVRLHTQQQIRSMQSAVDTATSSGVRYNEVIKVDGWELKFSPPRETGQLPALIHAQPVR